MKIYEITQPVPITKRDMALKKQSDTALLKSKTSQDRMGLDLFWILAMLYRFVF